MNCDDSSGVYKVQTYNLPSEFKFRILTHRDIPTSPPKRTPSDDILLSQPISQRFTIMWQLMGWRLTKTILQPEHLRASISVKVVMFWKVLNGFERFTVKPKSNNFKICSSPEEIQLLEVRQLLGGSCTSASHAPVLVAHDPVPLPANSHLAHGHHLFWFRKMMGFRF